MALRSNTKGNAGNLFFQMLNIGAFISCRILFAIKQKMFNEVEKIDKFVFKITVTVRTIDLMVIKVMADVKC